MRIHPEKSQLEELTRSWTGDRFASGRPRVPDHVLEGLRLATTEEAWSSLFHAGYPRQFAGGWRQTHPGTPLVGRAVTVQFLPHRPDLDEVVVDAGAREGHREGDRQNSWPIETLEAGDVMVVDIFGKIVEGTVVGDNLGTAVASRTGVGAVIDGGVRDLHGLCQLDGGVNFFYRDTDPTPIRDVTLAGINIPIRIDGTTVLPGDIILGTASGVSIIPPHLASEVAASSEDTRIRDVFGKQRLAQRRYTSAQIDVPTWSPEIEADFQQWRASQGHGGAEGSG